MLILKDIAIALYSAVHQSLEQIASDIINPYQLISKVPTRISLVARKNKMQIGLTYINWVCPINRRCLT